jgi:hypothetical protein
MFSDLPLLTRFHQERRNQPETRSFVWKNPDYPGTSTDLFVDPFQTVGGPDRAPVFQRKVEHCKPFRQVITIASTKPVIRTGRNKEALAP